MSANFDLSTQSTNGIVINENLVELNKAWCTETNAPEILPFRSAIIDTLQRELIGQQVRTYFYIFSTFYCLILVFVSIFHPTYQRVFANLV